MVVCYQLDRKMTPNHKSIVEMLDELSHPVEVSTVGTEVSKPAGGKYNICGTLVEIDTAK